MTEKKSTKSAAKASKKEVKAPVDNTAEPTSGPTIVDAPEIDVKLEVKGNKNPITNKAHDCLGEGNVRSIGVGGKRMTQCNICGNRF